MQSEFRRILRIYHSRNNGEEPDAQQQFSLTVYEATEITSDDHTTFTVGTDGQFTVQTSGGYPTPPITLTCCDLPAALSFADNGDGSATLHGTPAAGTGGVYLNFIHADNDGGQREQDFYLTINEAPAITSANQVTFHEDTGTSFTVTATGYPAPTLSENGALPSGITFNPTTGVLSGSAALVTAGTYPITFTASNGIGSNAVQNFTLTIAPPLPCTSPPAGLVGWWTADGHATDIQNDNNGTLHGSASFTAGRVGQAFNLNGSTDYISLGHPDVLKWLFRMQASRITIEAWVKPTALPPNGSLMAVATKWNSNSSNSSSGDAYGLFLINNNGTLQVLGKVNSGGALIAQGGTVPLNSFTHVAMTYDQENYFVVRVYVNGVDVGFADFEGPFVFSDVDVMIGRENDNVSPNYFAGVIDEVGIYDHGLTQAELSAIYNAGANGKCKTSQCVSPPTNIIGWWPGDNTAIDIQGGHNSILLNGTSFTAGKVGGAFSNNQGIEVPDDPAWDLGADPFTVETWIRLDGLNSYAPIVEHEQTGSSLG